MFLRLGRPTRYEGHACYVLLLLATLIAYIPTFIQLAQGPWQTEQEGHGPLIIAASLWLVWASRERLAKTEIVPVPVVGWAVFLVGLAMLFMARTQDLISVEVLSELPVITGCILMLSGWKVLKILAFPIGFLFFTVPAPGWMVDGATVPLKVYISDWVTRVLYAAGYPVAQNGVVIMIGPFQLLMQDACAGHEFHLCSFCNRNVLCVCLPVEIKTAFRNIANRDNPDYDRCQLSPCSYAGLDRSLWGHRTGGWGVTRSHRYRVICFRINAAFYLGWFAGCGWCRRARGLVASRQSKLESDPKHLDPDFGLIFSTVSIGGKRIVLAEKIISTRVQLTIIAGCGRTEFVRPLWGYHLCHSWTLALSRAPPSLESALDRIADHAVGGLAAIVLLGNDGDCGSRSLEGQPRS